MSENEGTKQQKENAPAKEQPMKAELTNKDLDHVAGGGIPGESLDDQHPDWIEVL